MSFPAARDVGLLAVQGDGLNQEGSDRGQELRNVADGDDAEGDDAEGHSVRASIG
jgi:hypothetical protein